MRPHSVLPLLSLLLVTAVHAITWTATPFSPASYPLAVRSPYLSAWLHQGSGTALNDGWAKYWTGHIMGWAGFVRVDDKTYSYLGAATVDAPFEKAVQKSATFTSTQSVFVLTAGPVDITVTFLSPVEPNDLARLSLPFSYMAVSAKSNDKKSHSVTVYSDISGEWAAVHVERAINWTTTSTGRFLTHQAQLIEQTPYDEHDDLILHGSAYYSITNIPGTTFQTGSDKEVRANFIKNGTLPNTKDTRFRPVNDNWPVFAFAQPLGKVGKSQSTPVVFSVGHVRDPAVQYIITGGEFQDRSVYFWTRWRSVQQAIAEFLPDFSAALRRANTLDAKIQKDATSKVDKNYAALVALSIRQVFGAVELTVPKKNGAFDTSDIIMFMKEISSNGNTNTVDVIFPTWPALLYLNPTLGKYLLLSHFKYSVSGQYPNKWSVHDLGTHYPRAIGHNDGNDEAMPVEESGNMLIMALSYTQKTGDTSLIKTYSKLLDQWTQFLIADSLIPEHQLSTDDFAGPLANQTNLAIKGIVGIRAMGEIYKLLGNRAQATNYTNIAQDYVKKWQVLATSKTEKHLTLNYNDDKSWGLSYNLYGDRLLKLNLFPKSVYNMQTQWYKTVANEFGVPLDTRHTYTKSDWLIWTAAIVTEKGVRNLLIDSVTKYAASGANAQALGDWYETTNARAEFFRARPVVGGHLALLDL